MDNQDTYFVADSEGNIKIGRGHNIRERLMQFRRERGGEMTLLAIISDDKIELELHCKFAHLRVDGEWYKPEPELVGFIEGLECNPMTLSELNEAKQRLGWGFRTHEQFCTICGEHIPYNHLLYPDFDYRYEHYYRHDNFICLFCYRRDGRRAHLCERLIRASVTRPVNWPLVWHLRNELERLSTEDDCDLEISGVHQPRLM